MLFRYIFALSLPISPFLEADCLLGDRFSIEGGVLITHNGSKHQQYPYESNLHFSLNFILKDPLQSKVIHDAYVKHLLPTFTEGETHFTQDLYFLKDPFAPPTPPMTEREAFTNALLRVCLLFNHPFASLEKGLTNALYHQGDLGSGWIEKHPKEYWAFLKEATTPLYTIPPKSEEEPFTVVIITTSASGGNHSVANAMEAYLSGLPHTKAIVIDIEEIAKEVEPIMIATGTHTFHSIYSSMFQQTNNFRLFEDRVELEQELDKYIPNTLLAALKERVISLRPDLIISTRTFTPEDLSLASLGVPFRMFHTEFELSLFLDTYYGKVDGRYIKFWLPTQDASMFKPLFKWYNNLDLYNENDDYDLIMQKMSSLLNIPTDDLKDEFEVLGYPVCPEFHPIDDLEPLRHKWGIQKGEIPIFIVMGKHGTIGLKEIFHTLQNSPASLAVKYFFVCGKNPLLKSYFESLKPDHKFVILGQLSPQEMNELMNISHLGISKAGGPGITEPLTTNLYLLMMHTHPWEEPNVSYLVNLGRGARFDPKLELMEQIESGLKHYPLPKGQKNPLEMWQKNLDQTLIWLKKDKNSGEVLSK